VAAIESQKRDGAAWIALNRPERLNSFTPESYRLLRDAVRTAEADDDIDIIVISGTGRAFATGADLDALDEALSDPDPTAIFAFGDNFPFETIRDSTKVTIAAVNGLCLGAGMIIAASCDLVLASEGASFSLPEGRVGIADPFAPAALFSKIPTNQLKYLALTGESISARQAHAMGLVTQVVNGDDGEALLNATETLIDALRRTTPTARRLYKHYIDDLLPRARAKDAFESLLSEEGRSAVAAYLARRRSRTAT
jgi:enoyl-CoA hydratase/carnithine racemase